MVQEHQDKCRFITNMWAVLAEDNKTVIACITPDHTVEDALKMVDGKKIIHMTLENSPAYVNGEYIDGKFYPPNV